jgi:hypothetical protein
MTRKRKQANKANVVVPAVRLAMKGPGFLGFVLPVRPDLGLHDVNTQRSNMVRLLADHGPAVEAMPMEERAGPALSTIQEDERTALLLSLATTVCRAEYHERRFWRIVEHLVERRSLIGAPLSWDAFVHSAVFEGAAALGATRTIVDEMVHIAARRHGHKKWEVSDALNTRKAVMEVPEVYCLRERAHWFDQLNNYRNVLYHRGWKGEAGAYFPADSPEPESRNPERNLLLMPDIESLRNDARAHQWTYKTRTHLEPLLRLMLDGMREFVDAVCISVWEGKVPKLGTVAADEQPNTIVTCPRPIPFGGSPMIYLPIFSSEQRARAFNGYPPDVKTHLRSLPLLKAIFPAPAFALCISGFEPLVTMGSAITVVIDPVDVGMKNSRLSVLVPSSLLEQLPFMDPLGLPRESVGVEQLFCWQQW